MPNFKSRQITLTFDMGGCPNRCKHCWLGHTPNKKMTIEQVKAVKESFENYQLDGQKFFEKINVYTWYREPDYLDNYQALYELECDLSHDPERFELLSIWRLARDEDYVKWAKEIGTKVCQISFFGLEENTDFFTGRIGAFKDNLVATERLLAVGIIPRWQFFLNEKNISELEGFVKLIKGLKLDERVKALGEDFTCFMHIPSPDGEAYHLEDIRPTEAIYDRLPDYLVRKTLKHFDKEDIKEVLGHAEKDLIDELMSDHKPLSDYYDLAFMITPDLDIYPNLGEPKAWWSLGNLKRDALDDIIKRFITNDTLGLKLNFEIPVSTLASRFGNSEGQGLYVKEDLIRRIMRQWGEAYGEGLSDNR